MLINIYVFALFFWRLLELLALTLLLNLGPISLTQGVRELGSDQIRKFLVRNWWIYDFDIIFVYDKIMVVLKV